MTLFVRLLTSFLRQMRCLQLVEVGLLGAWAVALVAMESAGRRSSSDLVDAAMLLALASLALSTFVMCDSRKRRPALDQAILVAARSVRRVWRGLASIAVDLGADFRKSPSVPRGFPAPWKYTLLALLTATPLLAIGAPWLPGGLRAFLAPRCYLAWLLLVGTLWVVFVPATLLMVVLAWATIRDALLQSFRAQGRRPLRREFTVVAAIVVALICGSMALPAWVPLAMCGAVMLIFVASIAVSSPGLELLWRSEPEGPVRSLDGRAVLAFYSGSIILLAIDLLLLSQGESLGARSVFSAGSATPITRLLGGILGWSSVGGLGALAWEGIRFARLGRKFNPARPPKSVAAVLHIQNSPEDVRQWEIAQRRKIIRGLEKLFKRAARREYSRGTGFWIGLQHWFVLGLSRDDDVDATEDREAAGLDGIIGPPFHRVISTEARYHYGQIAQSLEIDLIFVEDGVSFRRLVRVLRVLFEIYDIHGGRQRAEERHFSGLPGTCVVIHNFDLAEAPAHGRTAYPEPDYDEIGRARILHVFKDRQEDEELATTPDSSTGIPVLSGAY